MKYGSYLVTARGSRKTAMTLACPLDNVNDTEIYIYSASQLASVGDLSGLMAGFADFSMATKLQDLKIGDSSDDYSNGNLTELYLGNNTLLKTLDVRNCPNLTQAVDISGCTNLEEAYFDGTGITGLSLPDGGVLKTLHLPATVTNLTIRNQTALKDFTMPSYRNISTLWLEGNSTAVNTKAILRNIPEQSRVRLIGFSWECTNATEIDGLMNILDKMRGLDEYGNNTAKAQVSGYIHTKRLSQSDLASYKERYPSVTVECDQAVAYIDYYTYNGSDRLYREEVLNGEDGKANYSQVTNPPRRAYYNSNKNTFTFAGWSFSMYQTEPDADALKAVTEDRKVYAVYKISGETYRVSYCLGTEVLASYANLAYGDSPVYPGEDPEARDGLAFAGWNPPPTYIKYSYNAIATFGTEVEEVEITDTWAQILASCKDGSYRKKYKLGNYKELTVNGYDTIKMQIVGMDMDPLADGTGWAPLTWNSKDLLKGIDTFKYNPNIEVEAYETKTGTAWTEINATSSNQRRYCTSDIFLGHVKEGANAKGTWKVTATEDGTLTILCSRNFYMDKVAVTIGEETLETSSSTSSFKKEIAVTAGDVVTVEAEFTYGYSSSPWDENRHYAYITISSTGTFEAELTAEQAEAKTEVSYTEGTGTIGGWGRSQARTWMNDELLPCIPENVRTSIKPVNKYTRKYGTDGEVEGIEVTSDRLWLPSTTELNLQQNETFYDGPGPIYNVFYSEASRRSKPKHGEEKGFWYAARTSSTRRHIRVVTTEGGMTYSNPIYGYGVCLGFCT